METTTTRPTTPTSSANFAKTTGAPTEDIVQYAKQYARQNPDKAALWCLGLGFVLGWKLKPW